MRLVLGTLVLAGCNLYFGHHGGGEDDYAPPDGRPFPPPDAVVGCSYPAVEYCVGGTIYEPSYVNQPGVDCPVPVMENGTPIGTCPNGCVENTWGDQSTLCYGASPTVYTCTESGACNAGDTDGCAAPVQCGAVVSAGSCSCNNGTWSCADACDQGICGAAALQAKIAGDWTGTVSPPSFAHPYTVHLHISASGAWSATSDSYLPFYYGDNGGNAGSRIVVQAQTTVGGYASIGLFGGEVQGLIDGLQVDDTHMSFQFVDSWLSCTRIFQFDLHR
ncbi:MAG: hypothetical protein QM831_00725 [Kofleriaceae bacterium]